MDEIFEIITVNAENVDQHGFFCYMSKRKAPGYTQKREWLAVRFTEGLKIHMVHEIGGRTVGFIEYIPGEFAWRAVHAPGYLVIHCLWVVGKGAEKGIPFQVVTFQSAQELQENSPSPYGVFGIVLDDQLLAYHYLQHKDFEKYAQR